MAIKPTLALIPSSYKASKVYSVLPNNGDGDFTFSRASNATRVNKNGLIETVSSNIPRLDYADGSCPSLLLEPQRSNLIKYSEDFTNSAWTKTSVDITNSDEVSPSGYLNAKKMTGTATSTKRIFVVLSTTASLNYTYSLYVKKGNTSLLTFVTSSGSLYCIFNLDTLTASNGSIEDAGNGWYRLSAKATASSTTEVWQILLDAGQSAGTFHHIYGAQVEQGSYPTSYIPTSGIEETRLADNCYGAGDSNLFDTTDGVIYAELQTLADEPLNRYVSLSDGGGSPYTNSLSIQYRADGSIRVYLGGLGTSNLLCIISSVDATNINKIAVRFKNSKASVFLNGVIQTNYSGYVHTNITGLNELSFHQPALNINNFHGKCKDIRFYNEALTDTELATLTSL